MESIKIWGIMLAFVLPIGLWAQAPSSILPDLSYFKLSFPLDVNGNDYTGVSWNNRSNPLIKSWERNNLVNWTPNSTYSPYFFVDGNEVVFKAHCAGALTSANAYPRCELRETPNGTNDLWLFSDEHELNATFRVTNVPNEKQEVCMLQIKGNDSNNTSGTEEAFRLEYRQDGTQGIHVTINENTTLTDIMDYSVGQTIESRMYVNNGQVTIELDNLNVSGSNGEWNYTFNSNYSHGYFKAGCYTQSSIWEEKNGVADESPTAFGEVRFSVLTMGPVGGSCTASAPGNRTVGSIGTSSATVSWNSIANIDHYKVRHRAQGTSTWTTSGSIRNTTSYTISGLSANTTYEWQVRSKCSNNTGSNYNDGQGPNFTTIGSTTPCTSGSNLAENESIVDFSSEQSTNPSGNLNDGNSNNRWSAQNFPQYAVIDLGATYLVDEINLMPYKNRAYQFRVEGSTSSSTSGFSTLTDATGNTSGGSVINRSFTAQAARYIKLTITGASGYSGSWSSIEEFEVICAGSSNRMAAPEMESLRYFPNPFSSKLGIELPLEISEGTRLELTDMMGRVNWRQDQLKAGEKLSVVTNIPTGIYLLRWINADGSIIQTEKVIKK
ncbi:MAG: polysaccharide lyase family 7 protein [Bacteroidia bacterium]|nr:polysaccharide lyase family 7 protein [Bacteroidia bacterium]